MTNKSVSRVGQIPREPQNLSPEERAVIDSVDIAVLRKVFTAVWQMKLRLQFTGWLQYLPSGILSMALFFVAAIANAFAATRGTKIFLTLGVILSIVFVFDLVTVKFRLRFPESLPERNDGLALFDLMPRQALLPFVPDAETDLRRP